MRLITQSSLDDNYFVGNIKFNFKIARVPFFNITKEIKLIYLNSKMIIMITEYFHTPNSIFQVWTSKQ